MILPTSEQINAASIEVMEGSFPVALTDILDHSDSMRALLESIQDMPATHALAVSVLVRGIYIGILAERRRVSAELSKLEAFQ